MENTSTVAYVRRYDYDWDDETNLYTMCERVDGPYVSHDDYDALRAKRDAAVRDLHEISHIVQGDKMLPVVVAVGSLRARLAACERVVDLMRGIPVTTAQGET